MSMIATPVTLGDVQNVQIGVGTFTDMNAAQQQVTAIAAGTTSLNAYATGLVAGTFGVNTAANWAPVSIAVDNLILGGVPPAGALGSANELQNLTQNFAPPQAALATKSGLANPTVYVTEQMAQGLASAGDTNLAGSAFTTLYGISTTTAPTAAQIQTFAQNIQTQTGAAASTTVQEANFWISYYTTNGLPPGISNLKPWVAGLAAAAGDAIGQAIVANVKGTNFSQQLVFNALVDNAEVLGGIQNPNGSKVAYKAGALLSAQQVPVPLQSSGGGGAGSVAISDVAIVEGNNGTQLATFTVIRTGGTAAFDVNFATQDGTATVADKDYVAASGALHFGANQNTQTIAVTINGDTKVEPNETFNVLLSGATNGATISHNQGAGTIINDDGAGFAGSVAINDVAIVEGNNTGPGTKESLAMSMIATPVTLGDVQNVQIGVGTFTDMNAAQQQVTAIAAGTTSLNAYATGLVAGTFGVNTTTNWAPVAISVDNLILGGVPPAGALGTANELQNLAINFAPPQAALASKLGLANPTIYVTEQMAQGLASAGDTNLAGSAFTTLYGISTTTAPTAAQIQTFAQNIQTQTGAAASTTVQEANFWISYYTTNGLPPGISNLAPWVAGLAAAAGDAIGAAIVGNSKGTNFSQQLVFNALVDNAEVLGGVQNPDGSKVAYKAGALLSAQQVPVPLQSSGGGGGGTNAFLTTGVDNATQGFSTSSTGSPLLNGFTATASNSTVSGTFGGAGATWTPGDQVIAASGTTGQIFNIAGIGAAGVIDPTSVTGNKVSGFQTVNITANTGTAAGTTNQAVKGDFTASGTEGAWAGMTNLSIVSAGNGANADTIKVDPTVALSITDTLTAATTTPLTVNGSLTTTITESNAGNANGGITVNGGSGTTTVSITQTETAAGNDGVVKIADVNGTSTTAAGTIKTITLDGLSHTVPHTFFPPGLALTGTAPNTIVDNALTNLTINNVDLLGAAISITNNLTTPTATTLTLALSHDGVGTDGFGRPNAVNLDSSLILVDVKNEISTIHLSLGAQNSWLNLADNGLHTLDTPTAGTGALVGTIPGLSSTITDSGAGAVNFDFSGLNGPNNIDVDRVSGVNNDVLTLGNFGTSNTITSTVPFTTQQHLVVENANTNNQDTIQFGSGAYDITDAPHPTTTNPHHYVNTAPDGAGLIAGLPTNDQWAEIRNANAAAVNGDTLEFKGDTVQNTVNLGAVATIQAGISAALSANGGAAHTAVVFEILPGKGGGTPITFIFDHAGTSKVNVSATDSLVEFVGIAFNGVTTGAGGVLHLA